MAEYELLRLNERSDRQIRVRMRLAGRRGLCKLSSAADNAADEDKWLDSPPEAKAGGEEKFQDSTSPDHTENIRDILDDLSSRLASLSVEKPARQSPVRHDPVPYVGKVRDEVKRKAVIRLASDDEGDESCEILEGKQQGPTGGSDEDGSTGCRDDADVDGDDAHVDGDDFVDWTDDDGSDAADSMTMPGTGTHRSAEYRLRGKIAKMLYPHQRDGLRWLWELHCGCTRGILGDDMGLGKTILILKEICDHPMLLTKKAAEDVLEGTDSMLNREELGMVEELANNLAKMTRHGDFQQTDLQVSCEICFIMSLLENLVQEGNVILIFSQTRKMLNLIQEATTSEGYKFLRIDGMTIFFKRDQILKEFQEGIGAPIFLLTSQVGGLGLTLAKADPVIVFDPAWNLRASKYRNQVKNAGMIKDLYIIDGEGIDQQSQGVTMSGEEKVSYLNSDDRFGTINIILRSTEGVHLIADRRSCTEDLETKRIHILDGESKLFKVNDRVTGVVAGCVGTFTLALDILKKIGGTMRNDEEPYLRVLVNLLKQKFSSCIDQDYRVGCTLTLVDRKCFKVYKDQFSVCCVHINVGMVGIRWLGRGTNGFVKGIGGTNVAKGLLEDWRPTWTKEQTEDLCARAVQEVSNQYWEVGGGYIAGYLNFKTRRWTFVRGRIRSLMPRRVKSEEKGKVIRLRATYGSANYNPAMIY